MSQRRRRRLLKARMILGALLLGAGLAAVAPGCNMVKGIGQDITSAAESTETFFME